MTDQVENNLLEIADAIFENRRTMTDGSFRRALETVDGCIKNYKRKREELEGKEEIKKLKEEIEELKNKISCVNFVTTCKPMLKINKKQKIINLSLVYERKLSSSVNKEQVNEFENEFDELYAFETKVLGKLELENEKYDVHTVSYVYKIDEA